MPESDQLDLFDAREAGARAAPVRAAEAPAALERLAAALPEMLHLGTSSWSFPGWEGIVWGEPATQRRLARDGLHAYARHPLLKIICLDRTYYAPLAAAEYADLVAAVPGHFRFVVKAPELLTLARFPLHPRYGERRGQHNPLFLEPDWALDAFLKPLRAGLEVQLGAVVFQLPPQDPGVFGGARCRRVRCMHSSRATPSCSHRTIAICWAITRRRTVSACTRSCPRRRCRPRARLWPTHRPWWCAGTWAGAGATRTRGVATPRSIASSIPTRTRATSWRSSPRTRRARAAPRSSP
jgi:hypothetical protein